MKKLVVFLLSVSLSAVFFTVHINAQNIDEPFSTHSFGASVTSSIKALEVTASGGSITVSGGAGSEAVVEMYVSIKNNSQNFSVLGFRRSRNRNNLSEQEIKQTIEEFYTIDIKAENGKLYAVASPKNRNKDELKISFKIRVPRQVNSLLRTNVGSIRIADLSGSQDFRTRSGSVTIENVSGKISGNTSVGRITVTNSSEFIDLSTGSGSIAAEKCSGEIKLRTSVGAIRLNELNGEVNITTGSGSITVENVTGKISGSTSVGAINVTNSSEFIDLSTGSGSIAAEKCSGEIKLRTSVGAIRLNEINGEVNITTGSGSIRVENVTGKITGSTSVGAITVTNSENYINLSTSSGSVTASEIKGVIKTETSIGSVNLKDISGSVEAKTGSGTMTVELKSVSEYVKLSQRGNGGTTNVNLYLPAAQGYDMRINANHNITTSELKNFSGNINNRNIQGTIANGGAAIDVNAGRVNLTFK